MKNNISKVRIFFDLALLLATFFLPWWIAFPLAVLGALMLKDFFEILLVGLWIDAVAFNGVLWSVPFLFLIISTILFLFGKKFQKFINIGD